MVQPKGNNGKGRQEMDPALRLARFKAEVMMREGYNAPPERPDDVKYEVAQSLGVPLREGDNGDLTTAKAGKVGGVIGGAMVKEMIRLAKERLNNQQ
ncbi:MULTISPECIES: alpha/beta-type small acid-soluble spore protein [Paenibacillus]|uniref:alpha/beta-type small acid-soluble spore protein n=1 Tax=Paenibacillus TaxID=44249 RepID=UPI0004B486EB|nr:MULTISPECIES: alpha/beta-type small acid-soluble spore protein [Paenibacillus]SMF28894.1 Small, acid-soluble spore protein, alpha/beta type [Paenibacillus barengoltzii]